MANRYLKDAVSEKIRPLDIEQKQNIMAKAIENPIPEPLAVFAMGLIDPETNAIIETPSAAFGTAASKDVGTTNGTVPLIGSGDKLPESVIPEATYTSDVLDSVEREVSSKLNESISAFDLIPVSEQAAIIDGTTTYDCAADLNAFLESTDTRPLHLPKGTYKYSVALKPKYNDRIIYGDGPTQTILMPTALTENGIECPTTNPPNGLFIKDLSFIGAGSTTQTSAGISSQHPDGDFYMAKITLDNVYIDGFETGVLAENLPLLTAYNCRVRDFVVGFDLIKCDTSAFHMCSAGNQTVGDVETGTCFRYSSSSGVSSGSNFSSTIIGGEFGNCMRFLDLQSGHVSVQDINIESINGSSVCEVSDFGTLRFIHARCALETGDDTRAVVRLNCDSGGLTARLTIADLWGVLTGWRKVEIVGALNYNADAINIGDTDIAAVWASTAGATAQLTASLTSIPIRRLTSAIPSGANHLGRVVSFASASGSSGGAGRSTPAAATYDGNTAAYTKSALSNDVLMRVLSATATKVGNVSTTETDIFTFSVPAGTVAVANEVLHLSAFGKFAANANNKQIRVLFGTDVILDTTALSLNDGSWNIEVKLHRLSNAVWQAVAVVTSDNTTLGTYSKVVDGTQSFAGARTMAVKATGGANDDIQLFAGRLAWLSSEFRY